MMGCPVRSLSWKKSANFFIVKLNPRIFILTINVMDAYCCKQYLVLVVFFKIAFFSVNNIS